VAVPLLAVGLILGLASCEPSYYRPKVFTPEQLESAAKQVEDKLVEIRNIAGETQRDRARAGASQAVEYSVTFTEDELNAFFLKWTELSEIKGRYQHFVRDPRVALTPGRVFLAGRASAGRFSGVVSCSFSPVLTAQGNLTLSGGGWSVGKLPVPAAFLDSPIERAMVSINQQLPGWRSGARVDSHGAANEAALKAVYGRLMLAALSGRSAPGVLLVPVDRNRAIAVRLTKVLVERGQITFQGQPLTATEQARFVEELKSSSE